MNPVWLIVLVLVNLRGVHFFVENCPNLDVALWKFNCSHKNLKWSSIDKLDSNTHAATQLDLSNNLFWTETLGTVVKNLSLNSFKQLRNTLNLSSNQFYKIESHAFYYITPIVSDLTTLIIKDSDLKRLEFSELDLSNNSFEIVPWNSLKSLPNLVTLRINQNPIKRLDLGDMADSSLDYFENFSNLYVNNSQIEYVDPVIFDLVKNLKKLDLSHNKIKFIDNFSKMALNSLYLFNNPLICDCRLLWFKRFMLKKSMVWGEYRNLRHTCLGNVEPKSRNYITESKTLFVNASSLLVKNNNLVQSDPFVQTRAKEINIDEIEDNSFFCDLEIKSHIENLGLENDKLRKIRLNCVVTGFPKPYVKWLLGQKDIVRDLVSSDSLVGHTDTKFGNLTYTVRSSLTMSLDQPVRQEDITCISFFISDPRPSKIPKPFYLKKGILFNIINQNKDENFVNQTLSSFNFTELTYQPSVQKNIFKDQPFIYYIIFGILFLFCIFVIISASVCLIRYKCSVIREEKEYTYSSGSDYSSINKRSTIYTGSNSLGTDSATMVPLKPDVIREHHDFSSIYGNFYRTPSKPSNYLNTLMISPESMTKNCDDNDSVYTNNHSIPIYNGSRLMQQSFDRNPVENSLFDDTRSSSRFSSKTFEENTEEYLEPKFDDLRKPKKYIKQSKI